MDMVLEHCQSLSDEEVVDRVLAGDTGLYELLMRRYNQRLFRVVRSVVTNDSEAEDVLQEAWVRAYEHLNQFAGRARFSTWVTKIAFYEALARVRKGARFTELDPDREENIMTDDPEKLAIRVELAQTLQSAMDRLPDTYRVVFMLREVEQLSTAETAESLGLSEEAVKTRLHRSRAMLRRDLESHIGPAVAEAYAFLGARCDRLTAAVLARINGLSPSRRHNTFHTAE
jgi:RNA polymerase sigma-70 factor, ECF subfamily